MTGGNVLARAAAAEWLKLRSVRSTWWFAGGAVLLMLLVAVSEAESTARALQADGAGPASVAATSTAISAAGWVRFVLGSLGMVVITSEYATRSIVVTLACTPSRTTLLLAKAAVVGAAVLAAGVVLAALGVAASAPFLGQYGDFDAGPVAAEIGAMGAHLALVAVLALGLGALIRRSAGTLTVLFVLLLVLPTMLEAFATALKAEFLATAAGYTPGPAGDRFMAGEPGFGLVLAAWAAAAVAAGLLAVRARDA
jgi:ABC-2 type transport system permease protein